MRTKNITGGIILLLFLLTAAIPASEAADRSRVGGIFKVLKNSAAQEVVDSVEIMEFMSFHCGHCYRFSKKEPLLRGRYPRRVRFTHVPIQWGDASTKTTEAYLIAKDMGKGKEMHSLLFRAAFEQKKDTSQIPVLEELAASIGLGKAFNRKLRSGEKSDEAQKNVALARELSINSTPSFIVAGNILVTGSNIEALTLNLDTIIASLLAQTKK